MKNLAKIAPTLLLLALPAAANAQEAILLEAPAPAATVEPTAAPSFSGFVDSGLFAPSTASPPAPAASPSGSARQSSTPASRPTPRSRLGST